MKKFAAEFIGTFWLVLGGCGSAVLAAAFPEVGIGLLGVSLAFGLTVLTIAYSLGHISGAHLNPAVSVGFWVGGRFSGKRTSSVYYCPDFGCNYGCRRIVYHCNRKRQYHWQLRRQRLRRKLTGTLQFIGGFGNRNCDDLYVSDYHSWRNRRQCSKAICRYGDWSCAHFNSPDQYSGYQYFGESSPQHQPGYFCWRNCT